MLIIIKIDRKIDVIFANKHLPKHWGRGSEYKRNNKVIVALVKQDLASRWENKFSNYFFTSLMQNARCLQFALVINETVYRGFFFFFYLTIWAVSLDSDPLDISAPSHIRGRQTENEDKNTVSAASCQRASPSLLAATVNVSFQPWYYHHAVYCFWRLEVCLTRRAVSCALVSFKLAHCKCSSAASRNGRVLIERFSFFSGAATNQQPGFSCFLRSNQEAANR